MVKKAEATIRSNFFDVEETIHPQIWTCCALTLDSIAGFTVSMQREDYIFRDWAKEFADVIYNISLMEQTCNIAGGLMVSADKEIYIMVSLNPDNTKTIFELAEKLVEEL